MFIIQRDELIINAIEKLNTISFSGLNQTKLQIKNLINDLKINLNTARWNEFELHFEKVHHDFYTRLNILFPNLTPNEKKLCAFLKLNLSTKEICALTQQTLKSVEVARTRLRQKLNLSQNENLASFISNI